MNASGDFLQNGTQHAVGVAAPFGCDLIFLVEAGSNHGITAQAITMIDPLAFRESGGGNFMTPPGPDFPCPQQDLDGIPDLWICSFDGLGLLTMEFSCAVDYTGTAGDVQLQTAGLEQWKSSGAGASGGPVALVLNMLDLGPAVGTPGVVTFIDTGDFTGNPSGLNSTAPAPPFPLNEE